MMRNFDAIARAWIALKRRHETPAQRHQRRCAECLRLLTGPVTPEEREEIEQLARTYVASLEQGC